ncbi:MAG: hypothetical protein JXB49_11190 [Bacteroidales bacterium]|nr:hypothetical protein [Bacteroidales bacterium]
MNTPPIKYHIGLLSIIVVLMSSCVDEDLFTFDDPGKIQDAFSFNNVIWSPAFTAPIGKTSVSLNRLFEEQNSHITITDLPTDSLANITDTLSLSPEDSTTVVIYDDSIYLSDVPALELDTTIQFNFGLTTQGLNEQTPKIKYVTLIFNITNNYPTIIESQASFLDAGGNVIHTLFDNPLVIEGGALNDNGRVQEAYVNLSQFVTLYEDEIENVLGTEYLRLETTIWLRDVSPEHYDEVMKFFSDYRVDIQIAIDFQVEVQVGEYTGNQ